MSGFTIPLSLCCAILSLVLSPNVRIFWVHSRELPQSREPLQPMDGAIKESDFVSPPMGERWQ